MKFRQQAVDYYSRQDRHLYPLKIVSTQSWLLLVLWLAVIVGAIFWLILGTVQSQVVGQGLLLTQQGAIYSVSAPFDTSQIKQIHVLPGDRIQQNQVLVELDSPSLEQEIKVTQEYLEVLQLEKSQLEAKAQQALAEEAQILDKKESMIQKIISIEEQNIENLNQLSQRYTQMLAKGLATQRDTTQILNELNISKQKLEQSYQTLIQIDLDIRQKKQVWDERIRELSLRIESEIYKLNQLRERNELSATLKSPMDGIVLNLQASPGDVVAKGKSIVTVSNLGQGLDMIAFFPPEEGKKLKVGMQALVTPLTIKPEEYGNMKGVVIKVSPFPANDEVMMSILKNQNLVRTFAQDSAPLMVMIRISQDSKTPTGYAWTTSEGPREPITPGTVSQAKVVVKKQAPWTLVLPTFKKLLGDG